MCKDTVFDQVLFYAEDLELTIVCYGKFMTSKQFKKEVPEEDVFTYFLHDDEGYIRVCTLSERIATDIVEESLAIDGEELD